MIKLSNWNSDGGITRLEGDRKIFINKYGDINFEVI